MLRGSSLVWEVLRGSKRVREVLGRSRGVLACLIISVRVCEGQEGSEVSWRDHESLGGYGWA